MYGYYPSFSHLTVYKLMNKYKDSIRSSITDKIFLINSVVYFTKKIIKKTNYYTSVTS